MIKVFFKVYNEEILLPLFLKHYSFADSLHAIYTPSTDRTEEILRANSKVVLDVVESPDGLNDLTLTDRLNLRLAEPEYEHTWFMVPDVDEFIWPMEWIPEWGDLGGFTRSRLDS